MTCVVPLADADSAGIYIGRAYALAVSPPERRPGSVQDGQHRSDREDRMAHGGGGPSLNVGPGEHQNDGAKGGVEVRGLPRRRGCWPVPGGPSHPRRALHSRGLASRFRTSGRVAVHSSRARCRVEGRREVKTPVGCGFPPRASSTH